MTVEMSYPAIERWLGHWLDQLRGIPGDYRVLIDELSDPKEYGKNLDLLESDLLLGSELCIGFRDIIFEKEKLPTSLHEANKTVLNKLAEIRAVVGLISLGFTDVRSLVPPGADISAYRTGLNYAVEVTRLGASRGRRSKVWDSHNGVVGLMSQHGAVQPAISEAIYREIEEKSRQLKAANADRRVVWISLGRDYLTAGLYELPGVGSMRNMQRTMQSVVERAMNDINSTDLYSHIDHAILSLGRDLNDIVVPSLEEPNITRSGRLND